MAYILNKIIDSHKIFQHDHYFKFAKNGPDMELLPILFTQLFM